MSHVNKKTFSAAVEIPPVRCLADAVLLADCSIAVDQRPRSFCHRVACLFEERSVCVFRLNWRSCSRSVGRVGLQSWQVFIERSWHIGTGNYSLAQTAAASAPAAAAAAATSEVYPLGLLASKRDRLNVVSTPKRCTLNRAPYSFKSISFSPITSFHRGLLVPSRMLYFKEAVLIC